MQPIKNVREKFSIFDAMLWGLFKQFEFCVCLIFILFVT